MTDTSPLFISFHGDGEPAGLFTSGQYPFIFESRLLLRYRLVDGQVVDLFEGLSDEEVLAKIEEDRAARQRELEQEAQDRAQTEPYRIFKTTIIQRLTDKELEVFDGAYQKQPLRARRMWDDCTELQSKDPYFSALRDNMTAVFGKDRAKELLAPIV